MVAGPTRPRTEHEIMISKQSIAAGRKQLAHGPFNRDDLAKEFGVPVNNVSRAVMLLRHGTTEEVAAVECGDLGLITVYDIISRRVPAAERIKTKTPNTRSAETVANQKAEAATWKELRQAIDLICGMPRPADMVIIAKRSSGRTATLDRRIIDAYSWLAEFSDAWTK
jgi:hypothetical protein